MSESSINKKENTSEKLKKRLSRIDHKIIVLSGKGGVGKSTVAVNLAVSLSIIGKRVGLLDTDIHGPSIPVMLNLAGTAVHASEDGILPVEIGDMKVMSIGFLLPERDDAVVWRGPVKMGVIQQFLQDVDWGDLDYLIIDSPPGTGDEPLSICQLIENPDGAVIVTTPQEVAVTDVRKSINFCRLLKMPILGVIENMSGFICPKCGEVTNVFDFGGGEEIASKFGVPFLGRIPLDPKIVQACDSGIPFTRLHSETETAALFQDIFRPIINLSSKSENSQQGEDLL